jgi:glycosyltransferase involved in cell wall biosynthesis/SAM-dependent methyltransferase
VRIAVVGPTHPIKGGVSQHTTVLAQRLTSAGHDVEIVSWLRQYPQRLYPGQQNVSQPEFEDTQRTRRVLSWNRPDTWWREARRLRSFDVVVFAHITPVQVPAYRVMIAALRGAHVRLVVICHNVLPHERSPFDKSVVSSLLRAADLVIVHSDAEAALARPLTTKRIVAAAIAPFMPDGFVQRAPMPGEHRRLLFFGLVRPYKGLDVLLRALAEGPPDVRLRVAGEFWGGTRPTEDLCRELGILDRVEFRTGYVDATEVPALFSDVDALVLPYRSATGSQGVWTGFEFGVPVIATRVGNLPDSIRVGIDGLLADPDNVESLAKMINQFYQPGVPERMRIDVKPVDPGPFWDRYLDALLSTPGRPSESSTHAATTGSAPQEAAPPGGRLLSLAKIGAERLLWARVATRRSWAAMRGAAPRYPKSVPPNDVLSTAAEYEQAVEECRSLNLPLHRDLPKNWDALGAVSVVMNTLGPDIRVLDAGAARYSTVLPALRLLGVRELVGNNLEFRRTTHRGSVRFEPGDITATQYKDNWFDAVTCMSVIEHGVPLDGFAAEAARILRPSGLLIISTDYDQSPPDTTGKTAYGVPVKIFGPQDIADLVEIASRHGLDLVGELKLAHRERPVHWKRTGLDYTFIRLTFVRR